MSNFVAEKENRYITYYILKPKKGRGFLINAFSGQQAIAKVMHFHRVKSMPIVCVTSI